MRTRPKGSLDDLTVPKGGQEAAPRGVVARIDLRSGVSYLRWASACPNRDGLGCLDHAIERADGNGAFAQLAIS